MNKPLKSVRRRGLTDRRPSVPRLLSAVCLFALWGAPALALESPATSSLMPAAERSLLLGGARVGEQMWVVGERGHILYSEDLGQTWEQAAGVPTMATLTAVYFHDARLGWVVGHNAVILRTRDGGRSWERVFSAPELNQPLLDVWFEDAAHGFAVGAYGYFLETRDAGETWTSRRINEDDWHFNCIACADNGRMYIAAEAGSLYRSDDGGETWQSLPAPYQGSFHGVLPLGGDSVLVFGLRGHLFRSDDGGVTWEARETGVHALLTDAARLKGGGVVLVGTAGTVLTGSDGSGLDLVRLPDRRSLAGVLPAGDRLVVFGEGGVQSLPMSDARVVSIDATPH